MQASTTTEAHTSPTTQTFSFKHIGQPPSLLSRITAQNGSAEDTTVDEEPQQSGRSSPRMVDSTRTNPLGSLAFGQERASLSPETDYTLGWDPQSSAAPNSAMDNTDPPRDTSQLGYPSKTDTSMDETNLFASEDYLQYETFLNEFMSRSNASIAALDSAGDPSTHSSLPIASTSTNASAPSSALPQSTTGLTAAKKLVSATHSNVTKATEHVTASLSLAEKTVASAQEALEAFRNMSGALENVVSGYGDVMENLAKEDAKGHEKTRITALSRQKERQSLVDLQEWVTSQTREFQDKHFALASENAFLQQEISRLSKEKIEEDMKHRLEVSRLRSELATMKRKGGYTEDDRRKEPADGEGRRPTEGLGALRSSSREETSIRAEETLRTQREAPAQQEARRRTEVDPEEHRRFEEHEAARRQQQMEAQSKRRDEILRQKAMAQHEEATRIQAERSAHGRTDGGQTTTGAQPPSPVIKREPSPISVWPTQQHPRSSRSGSPPPRPCNGATVTAATIPPTAQRPEDINRKESASRVLSMSISRSPELPVLSDAVGKQEPITPATLVNQPSGMLHSENTQSSSPAVPVTSPASFVPSGFLQGSPPSTQAQGVSSNASPNWAASASNTVGIAGAEHISTQPANAPSVPLKAGNSTSQVSAPVADTMSSRSSRAGTPITLPPPSPDNNSERASVNRSLVGSPVAGSSAAGATTVTSGGQATGFNGHNGTFQQRIASNDHTRGHAPMHASLPSKPHHDHTLRPAAARPVHEPPSITGRTQQRDSRDGVDGRQPGPMEGRRQASTYRPASPVELRQEDRSYRPPPYSSPNLGRHVESNFVRGDAPRRSPPPPHSAPLPSDNRSRGPRDLRRIPDSYVPPPPPPGYDSYVPSSPRGPRQYSPSPPPTRLKRPAPPDDEDDRSTRRRRDVYRPDRSSSPTPYHNSPLDRRVDSYRASADSVSDDYRFASRSPSPDAPSNYPQPDAGRYMSTTSPYHPNTSFAPTNSKTPARNQARRGPGHGQDREPGPSLVSRVASPPDDRSTGNPRLLTRMEQPNKHAKRGKGNAQRGSGGRGGATSGRVPLGRQSNAKPSLSERIKPPSGPKLQDRISNPDPY